METIQPQTNANILGTKPPLARPQAGGVVQRILSHPRMMHYNRIAASVLLLNLCVLWAIPGYSLLSLLTAAQANFTVAILARNQYFINFITGMAVSAPVHWPLRWRWTLAKVYHHGGMHVGAALAGTAWYFAFVITTVRAALQHPEQVSFLNVSLSIGFLLLVLAIVVMAMPSVRARAHHYFEFSHRFFGWAALILAAINTALFVIQQFPSEAVSGGSTVWVVVGLFLIGVLSVLWPWFGLRRVAIKVTRPSSHAAIVELDHGVTPEVGRVRAISRSPLSEWHSFACLRASQSGQGYRMVISRAGDWTGEFIDHPPSHVWVRGIPTADVAVIRKLFRKVVYIATGSGLAPMLPHLLANDVPAHVTWVTRDPQNTYGDALVEEILSVQKSITIWNTDESGRPDMLKLAYDAYRQHGAEAVICVSNEKITSMVVSGLERCGIPAFGPVFDS